MADGGLHGKGQVGGEALSPQRDLLRFITCGSVDDGKSTLIGRLLYDAGAPPQDELERLERDSLRSGSAAGRLDFSLLVDGLAAEREQGITIDVAYRYFATDKRKFIVADTPGHEQYTRNMATGASTAEVAVILIDARKGVLTQTRRHSFLVSLMGIRRVALAVNKMDLVDFNRAVFDAIVADYRAFAAPLGFTEIQAIPVCAPDGVNVAARSASTDWYDGPTLIEYLETVPLTEASLKAPLRMSVQGAVRPDPEFRGVSGLITSGHVQPGDTVRVCPSGRTTTVARIVTYDGDLPLAVAGQSVVLTFADEVDASRGDVIAAADAPPQIADTVTATLVWMDDAPLALNRDYLLKLGARTVAAKVTDLHHRIDVNTLQPVAAETLALNGVGEVTLRLDQAAPFDPYDEARDTGGFILIDRLSNATAAAGMLRQAVRRADNIHWQAQSVDRSARARMKGQRPAVLWLTGLSGAGKSTLANRIELQLQATGRHTYILDGDNVRHGLNKDLGFTEADRVENIRRVAEVARLMADAGLIVLVAFISPFRADRDLARSLMPADEFIEVHVDAPLAVAEARDPKGLYRKARAGELKNFTGIDSPYEAPLSPEVYIDTTTTSPDDAAAQIVRLIEQRGLPGLDGDGI